jgi:hypothetical protein
MLYLESGRS